ncbi:MAG: Fic family protein [bacterium]|nr:Fic family protein [bacterium]
MSKTPSIFENIDSLRERYHIAKVDKGELITLLNETEIADQVYNSNAIENSTLTLEETEKILLQIEMDRYITERELFEAKNLARVMEYIRAKAEHQPLDKPTILLLHQTLLSNIRDEIAGRFREQNEFVRVGNHIAPPPGVIEDDLNTMLARYHGTTHLPIVERIAKLHLEFEILHPFVDGNGRIGRVINNYLLVRNGDVPINILFTNRAEYYTAFNEFAENGETQTMEAIVAGGLCNGYHRRLAYLESKRIMSLKEYAKQVGQSYSNILNKANRQTIPAFLERGKWKIGI